MTYPSILLARQPIFDRNLDIVAYELLFRSTDSLTAPIIDGDHATSRVLLNAFTELPIEDVVENKQVFVNFTRNLILNPPPIHHEHLVIEVLETVVYDQDIHESLLSLKKQGYTIALDDFVIEESLTELIKLADIIKLDVLALDHNELRSHLKQLRRYPVTLLAEKVETHEMFEQCKQMGFDLFQGYFLSKPQLISGNKSDESKQSVLKLINLLQNATVNVDEVVGAIILDPVLSLKLLRLINSSVFNLKTEISSIKHAITLLGLEKIRRWSTLLLFADSGDKPRAMSIAALNRARLCQLIGTDILGNEGLADSYFTAGLMSNLDAFLNLTFESIFQKLSLSKEIKNAILKRTGDIGFALATAVRCETADWENIDWNKLTGFSINAEQLEKHYLESISWTSQILKQI